MNLHVSRPSRLSSAVKYLCSLPLILSQKGSTYLQLRQHNFCDAQCLYPGSCKRSVVSCARRPVKIMRLYSTMWETGGSMAFPISPASGQWQTEKAASLRAAMMTQFRLPVAVSLSTSPAGSHLSNAQLCQPTSNSITESDRVDTSTKSPSHAAPIVGADSHWPREVNPSWLKVN